MNPKCQTRPGFDTFSAKSADSTGLFSMLITRGASLDHLVGAGEQHGRYVEAKRIRGFQVDHQFVLGRRLHREFAWTRAFEDTVNIGGRAPKHVGLFAAIGQETSRDRGLLSVIRSRKRSHFLVTVRLRKRRIADLNCAKVS
jgi:hypothetical protein